MRISLSWIKEWVPLLPWEAQELGNRLTMAGLELDKLERAAPEFSGVVVGHVLSVKRHPNADKLRLCQVDDGRSTLQVVCGAANVRRDMKVPFAQVGARLLEGIKIKAARLRGMDSAGMLCSATELGLAESSPGLMELPPDAPIGAEFRDYLDLNDDILEIDLTPNRSDCLSIRGVAREVAALAGLKLKKPGFIPPLPEIDSALTIAVEDFDACPRYAGRIIQGINSSATPPLWMTERLRRSGLRSINVPVDITNYVMLELGQPMHAFDLDRLNQGIIVRPAIEGESLALLDGQTVTISPGTLLITDGVSPLALAGIMGGIASAVSENTVNIFLESAFFDPQAIGGRARQLGLHTDSSHRFERGIDPTLQRMALDRATQLLLQIAGGQAGPVSEVFAQSHVSARGEILLRRDRIVQVAGYPFDLSSVDSILNSLGCQLETVDEGWQVRPPAWRFDLALEADLIEELIRMAGYDKVPEKNSKVESLIRVKPDFSQASTTVRRQLCDLGYQEVITYSFIDSARAELFLSGKDLISLVNPISRAMSVMRPSLWPGLATVIEHNQKRQQQRGRYFEIGLRFYRDQNRGIQQIPTLAGAAYGNVFPEQWGMDSRSVDFYDLKGNIEELLSARRLNISFHAEPHPALHGGQSARIGIEGTPCGWVGMLHPEWIEKMGLVGDFGFFELDLKPLLGARVPRYAALLRHPMMRRDLAVITRQDIPVGDMLQAVRSLEIEELLSIHLFDVYTGKGVPVGCKSLAFGLLFQGRKKSLTDKAVDVIINKITNEFEKQFSSKIRGADNGVDKS